MSVKNIAKRLGIFFLVTIRGGPLRDYRWIAGTGTRFIKGLYEPNTVEFLEAHIKTSSVCYDIGGHIGYLSLIMSKLAGDSGKVFVFEPRPINIAYIERHIRVNEVRNVVLLKTGISNYQGDAQFDVNRGSGTGRISTSGELTIPIDTIDALLANGQLEPPHFLKMDIEGEELNGLMGASGVLKDHRPVLNISTHNDDIHRECVEYVTALGYEIIEEFRGGFTAS